MNNNYVTIWNQKFEKSIADNSKDFFSKCFNDELNHNYQDVEGTYLTAVSSYKSNHNSFSYNMLKYLGLPLSLLCLIFPFFPAWKKYKQLRDNKQALEKIVADAKDKKLLVHQSILLNIDLFAYLNMQYKTLGYKHIGAINEILIDELQQLSLFDLGDSTNINPYNTSWGVLDNTIIINSSKQTHEITSKTYSNSITVTANEQTQTYYASYTHPFPEIKLNTRSFAFMESCSNLSFNYEKEYFGNLFKKSSLKSKGQSALENPDFEKNIHWIRNDEIQFRMIFTPLGQEIYLDEVLTKSKNQVSDEFRFQKISSFFTNAHFRPSILMNYDNNIEKCISNFYNNPDYKLEQFQKDLHVEVTKHIFDFYLSVNYLWIIPIFQSENHMAIVNKVLKSKVKNPCITTVHYLLTEILQHKVLIKDTDTFHQVASITNFDNNENIFLAKLIGVSYDAIKKTKYVSVYTIKGSVNVPIDYIDYIPYEKEGFILYTNIDGDYHYMPHLRSCNLTDPNILEKITLLNQNDIILCIAENYLIIYSDSQIVIENLSDLINELLISIKSSLKK